MQKEKTITKNTSSAYTLLVKPDEAWYNVPYTPERGYSMNSFYAEREIRPGGSDF